MLTMTVDKFKSAALKLFVEVSQKKESIIITQHGKPLAKIIPFGDLPPKNIPGKLASTLLFEKDIISPVAENEWESCK
jgi:prevent-host-death family protein